LRLEGEDQCILPLSVNIMLCFHGLLIHSLLNYFASSSENIVPNGWEISA